MRKTLYLDDDVAALLERVRKTTNATLQEVVNAAWRDGLERILQPAPPRKKFRTKVHSPRRCYLPNLDNTVEVMASAEGEWHK